MQQTSQLAARLDSLPNELLLAILAHLPPPRISLGSGSAPSQRNELFAVQLTSKHLKDVCTPVLWDRLELCAGPGERGETERLTFHLRKLHSVREGCRTLRLEAFDWSFMPPYLADGVRLLPNVEELSMRETMPITLDVVARFDRLRYLDIEYAELLPPSSQIVFANLVRMSLANVTIHPASSRSSSFFDTSALPCLRELRLSFIWNGDSPPTGDDARPAPIFSSALVRQLDQLHLERSQVRNLCDAPPERDVLPVEALTPDVPILWRISLGGGNPPLPGLPPLPARLTFVYVAVPEPLPDVDPVPYLRAHIAAHPFLRLVLVPLEFWRAAPRTSRPGADGPDAASASASFEAVVAECAARGLAVRPYDAGREREGFVPREAVQFWRKEGVGRT